MLLLKSKLYPLIEAVVITDYCDVPTMEGSFQIVIIELQQ